MPSPLGQLQQLTINDNSNDETTEMSTNEMTFQATIPPSMSASFTNVDDDVEATRQKILDDILSTDGQKTIPDNFESILNPIYFDFVA
jgi:hypothetical protein